MKNVVICRKQKKKPLDVVVGGDLRNELILGTDGHPCDCSSYRLIQKRTACLLQYSGYEWRGEKRETVMRNGFRSNKISLLLKIKSSFQNVV